MRCIYLVVAMQHVRSLTPPGVKNFKKEIGNKKSGRIEPHTVFDRQGLGHTHGVIPVRPRDHGVGTYVSYVQRGHFYSSPAIRWAAERTKCIREYSCRMPSIPPEKWPLRLDSGASTAEDGVVLRNGWRCSAQTRCGGGSGCRAGMSAGLARCSVAVPSEPRQASAARAELVGDVDAVSRVRSHLHRHHHHRRRHWGGA